MCRNLRKSFDLSMITMVASGFILSSCSGLGIRQTQTVLETPSVTETPPIKTLVICLGEEPQSLYLYGGSSQATWSVLESIYDGPIDTSEYEPVPVILSSLPTLENGGIVLDTVTVTQGDEVANVEGDLVALQEGVTVFPSGCTSNDCAVQWDGQSDLSLVQMKATFILFPDLKWSDGQPLTAEDSVYSFDLSADPSTNVSKNRVKRTADYQARDEQTIQWTGIPGYLTRTPASFFWIPQPKHLLGSLSTEELNTSVLTNKKPIGWGPYQIEEWTAGDQIRLVRNPNYFRAAEGFPKFDVLVYRFLPGFPQTDLSPMVTGQCDIMDPSTGLESQIQSVRELELGGKLKSYFGQGPSWEGLNFGIRPASYDDTYNPYLDRQDFFGDIRIRQAFAYCIDRDKIIKDVFFSQSQVPASYLPANHPLVIPNLPVIQHDPAKGIQLLEEAGWVDKDGDTSTPRTAEAVSQVLRGTEFIVNDSVIDSPLHRLVTEIVVESLAECGIKVTPGYLPATEMLAAGPEGLVFGRNFDLAELAWSSGTLPPCFLYSSLEIPSDQNGWLGTKYGGVNFTGYSNESYDASCSNLLTAGLDEEKFMTSNKETQTILSSDLPVIPLFYPVKGMVSRVDLCGLKMDTSSRSPMSSIESLEINQNCGN
ncbi:MAG: ABC transporter substrate-binding protein [Chloroflexi bacterium]|nr:ABC transporter substrate-binding protein [Chloroflexota bacterium]